MLMHKDGLAGQLDTELPSRNKACGKHGKQKQWVSFLHGVIRICEFPGMFL